MKRLTQRPQIPPPVSLNTQMSCRAAVQFGVLKREVQSKTLGYRDPDLSFDDPELNRRQIRTRAMKKLMALIDEMSPLKGEAFEKALLELATEAMTQLARLEVRE